MELVKKADVVLALGTRLSPFSTLPAYNMTCWPEGVKLIQVDINGDRTGLTKPVYYRDPRRLSPRRGEHLVQVAQQRRRCGPCFQREADQVREGQLEHRARLHGPRG